MVAAVIIAGVPQQAFADGPTYDPVFYYYHTDHLGSSQVMTDREGNIVQRYGYSAFGREWHKSSTEAFSISNRYTGQILDEETGLYYLGFPIYTVNKHRFLHTTLIIL